MAVVNLVNEKEFDNGSNLPLVLYKWINYEYWPWWLIYTLVLPYYLYLSIRAKNIFFFTNINPSILHSGFKNYDKLEVQKLIPDDFLPFTLSVKPNDVKFSEINKLTFPVVVKPINGERGRLVKVIHSKEELVEFLSKIKEDFIIQEYITLPNEATILWINHPNKGKIITSFTTKEMMSVTGNGKETIKQLLLQNQRFRLQIKRLEIEKEVNLEIVLRKGEKLIIEPIGNHCRGTKFINSNLLINQQLTDVFSHISDQIPDFNYGRFDFKYDTLDALFRGENIKILELNGASSDPVHIFDQKTGFFHSLKVICQHFRIMFDISSFNLEKGFRRAPVLEVIKVMRGKNKKNEVI